MAVLEAYWIGRWVPFVGTSVAGKTMIVSIISPLHSTLYMHSLTNTGTGLGGIKGHWEVMGPYTMRLRQDIRVWLRRDLNL